MADLGPIGVMSYGPGGARRVDLGASTPRGPWGFYGSGLSIGFSLATPRGPWGFAGSSGGGFAAAGHQGLYERDDSDGYLSPPCQRQMRAGTLKDIYWPVEPGTRTFKIMVRHGGHEPAPRVIVKANPEVGVLNDVETVQVTVTVKGVLNVWREVRAQDQSAYAKWDQVTVT